ncbi:GTPase [Thermococcus sibiricus]|uniref:GTPase, MMR1/HSR1 family n=1 Tax=Thermococcus sibiricus (strain DSM 12597 / MM 739) TaxID=604354 RepID=C6A029_THESM|nr:GTPase [Thermococcus sibiricus]ACS91010.1 GTPase, MMR1/HSR1 family [Thermococcus sibiricus MM 739]
MKQKKAWRVVNDAIREGDIILEVVDARDPIGTRNLKVEKIAQKEGKKLLIVMNKADLVPKKWAEEYKQKNKDIPIVFISARERKGTGILREEIKKLAKEFFEQGKDKVKVVLVGYPNVGKSTIINVLKGKHAVGTAPIPGYTKGKQLIRLSKKIWVVDSPGVVPIDDFEELVIRGGFPADKIEDPVKPALKLIKRLLETRKEAIIEKYGIIDFENEEQILKAIGEKKGLLKKGGKVNLEETARYLLREWQTGKFTLFGKEEKKNEEFIWDFESILNDIEKESLIDPRRILWKYGDKLIVDREKRVGFKEIEGMIIGIATGFKKCDSALNFLEKLTNKKVIASECFGGKWKGVIAILE